MTITPPGLAAGCTPRARRRGPRSIDALAKYDPASTPRGRRPLRRANFFPTRAVYGNSASLRLLNAGPLQAGGSLKGFSGRGDCHTSSSRGEDRRAAGDLPCYGERIFGMTGHRDGVPSLRRRGGSSRLENHAGGVRYPPIYLPSGSDFNQSRT